MKAPLSQTLFLTEDGSAYPLALADAVTIPPIVIGIPPAFDGLPSVQSDGTPQVGEQLFGIDAAVLNLGSAILRRAWLLGSTVLVEDASFTPDDDATYTYRNQLVVAGVVIATVSVDVTVAAATVTPTPPAAIPAPTVTITGTPRINDLNFTGSATQVNPDDGLQINYVAGQPANDWKTLTGSFQYTEDNVFTLDEDLPATGDYPLSFRVIRTMENEVPLDQPIYGMVSAPVPVTVQAAAAIPWTPAQLPGLVLWIDPQDTATVSTQSNGTTIASVTDKAKSVVYTPSGGRPTLISSGVGGKQSIAMSPSQYLRGLTSALPVGSAIGTMATVALSNGTATQKLFEYGGNGGAFRTFGMRNGYADFGTGAADHTVSSGPAYNGTAHIAIQQAGTSSSVWMDGTNAAYTSPLGYNTTAGPGFIGRHDGDTEQFDGQFGEIIMTASALSQSVRQKLEGYLAWRWNLTSLIPANHPYKSAAPTV